MHILLLLLFLVSLSSCSQVAPSLVVVVYLCSGIFFLSERQNSVLSRKNPKMEVRNSGVEYYICLLIVWPGPSHLTSVSLRRTTCEMKGLDFWHLRNFLTLTFWGSIWYDIGWDSVTLIHIFLSSNIRLFLKRNWSPTK